MAWRNYFDKEYCLSLPRGKFNIYQKGNSNLLLFCLHGAGFSALSYSGFANAIYKIIDCQVVAVDLRGHGKTLTSDDYDLSLYTLAGDVSDLISIIAKEKMVILVGHHLGGIVALEVARLIKNITCLCLLDIIDSNDFCCLPSLKKLLNSKPTCFKHINDALLWYTSKARSANLDIAEISILSQLFNSESKYYACEEYEDYFCNGDASRYELIHFLINKYRNKETKSKQHEELKNQCKYTWLTDPMAIAKHWDSWFHKISEKFLDVPHRKLLLLPHLHNMDSILTIAQMQKKFTVKALPVSGIVVIEDQAKNIAKIIKEYLIEENVINILEMPGKSGKIETTTVFQRLIHSKNRFLSIFGMK